MNTSKIQLLKQNFASGLVVFLVALPLCLGIALASGRRHFQGLFQALLGESLSAPSALHILVLQALLLGLLRLFWQRLTNYTLLNYSFVQA